MPSKLPFSRRHIGSGPAQQDAMLQKLGLRSRSDLTAQTIPPGIVADGPVDVGAGISEAEVIAELASLAALNEQYVSLIGTGYYGTITPPVLQRNLFENPGWYTQYTPYQAEISQGRMEALVNFQTMVSDLTGLPLANASLLDEATAAAEAMNMCWAIAKRKRAIFWASSNLHPQTIAVLKTRAEPLPIDLRVAPESEWDINEECFGALVQYPATDGGISDYGALASKVHASGALLVCATDLLALAILKCPASFGADIAIGSSQRFGVPMGYGGPHAAFIATHEKYRRQIPGRIIGVSKDKDGAVAYRLALQTREQHIRRDKATSNICTAQVLLAIMAGAYASYHGPEGLFDIASTVREYTIRLRTGLVKAGVTIKTSGPLFDTIRFSTPDNDKVYKNGQNQRINFRRYGNGDLGASLDETTTKDTLAAILQVVGLTKGDAIECATGQCDIPELGELKRTTEYLTHGNFHRYQTEHEMLRYLSRLQAKDISLTHSMIPLGSCTMKLNAAAEMIPVSESGFGNIHPHAPSDQTVGYQKLLQTLSEQLATITGFTKVSLQPNAGAQGEYAGLLAIRRYHHARNDADRKVCLVPTSAHGTNPASAVMAGFSVAAVKCDDRGNIDVDDLKVQLEKYAGTVGAIMITYPSTHGVFETAIKEICQLVHDAGGMVYLDGANMNAQVGICRPGDYGADVCHLNLHKTFCIPHGGGGPGMGPIGVNDKLAPFLPGDPLGGEGVVSAAKFGSPMILPIPYAYIRMMGTEGIKEATEVAILNANYMKNRLESHYDVLYVGESGRVAHEFILDCRGFKKSAGVTVDDIAKRLMDYGYHAPTMSFPVAGTLMIEPTESESREELDRFCSAMIQIRKEIAKVASGEWSQEDNPLVNAPHTAKTLVSADWSHSYSREEAVFPLPWVASRKYWPPVRRVDNAYGDRNLFCSCPPLESYEES